VGAALSEAKAAGWTVIVKEALANGRLAEPGRAPALLGAHPDVTALAAALHQPWADVVLCGAATVAQLRSNVAALAESTGHDLDRLSALACDPRDYWAARRALRWT
jgi:aryl-alcohol dehydrogenase-like predicted oxidoreductase